MWVKINPCKTHSILLSSFSSFHTVLRFGVDETSPGSHNTLFLHVCTEEEIWDGAAIKEALTRQAFPGAMTDGIQIKSF